MTFRYGVFIGRFQPFHDGHWFIVKEALQFCEHLIIVIGSAENAPSVKNPWDSKSRMAMILSAVAEYAPSLVARLHFVMLKDYVDAEAAWRQAVLEAVTRISGTETVALVGHNKDASSYYLREFPNWHYLEFPDCKSVHATLIRRQYFLNPSPQTTAQLEHLSHSVKQLLLEFQTTSTYQRLHNEVVARSLEDE